MLRPMIDRIFMDPATFSFVILSRVVDLSGGGKHVVQILATENVLRRSKPSSLTPINDCQRAPAGSRGLLQNCQPFLSFCVNAAPQ